MSSRLVVFFCLAICAGSATLSQGADPLAGLNEQQRLAVAEPFTGVTTNGVVVAGLFPLASTGISTAPVGLAAEAFLASLSDEQRKRTVFSVDDREWRLWINTPMPARQGVSFEELSQPQRERAFGLLRASLSARGLQKTEDVMKLNETLAELRGANGGDRFGQWKYWLTVMGTPSTTEPWGWQLDGHHLVINYFVLGDQVVMTPTFLGSEPVRAETGQFAGTVVLQDEQDQGLRLFTSLNTAQRASAAIRAARGTAPSLAGAYRDNAILDYAGIRAVDLDQEQREQLLELIGEYVGHIVEAHARIKMAEVVEHFDDTYFAWAGTADADGVFYYRVQSPVILIEFDHQSPADRPSRNHIHTVIRTPNGNDYGQDLLRQHYAQHAHAAD